MLALFFFQENQIQISKQVFEIASRTIKQNANSFFIWNTIEHIRKKYHHFIVVERNITFFPQKYLFLSSPTVKSTKHLGLSPKECTYLGVAYFLFKCQRSELILSCWRCMFALSTQYLFFPWRLAEVQHFYSFQSCYQKYQFLGLPLAEERNEKITFQTFSSSSVFQIVSET